MQCSRISSSTLEGAGPSGRSLAGIVGSNPSGGIDVCFVLSGRGFYVGLSLVQRSPTECRVSKRDREDSLREPWPTRGCCAMEMGGIKRQRDVQGEILDMLMDPTKDM